MPRKRRPDLGATRFVRGIALRAQAIDLHGLNGPGSGRIASIALPAIGTGRDLAGPDGCATRPAALEGGARDATRSRVREQAGRPELREHLRSLAVRDVHQLGEELRGRTDVGGKPGETSQRDLVFGLQRRHGAFL